MALRVTIPVSEPPSLSKTRPRLLDLYCGEGGAAIGYDQAGFEVVGVDSKPQPHYPFQFIRADVFDWLHENGAPSIRLSFDAVHASPPCQKYSVMRSLKHERQHPDLVDPTRKMLDMVGLPYVIENVPGSPLRAQVMLCGSMFGLKSGRGYLRRHRYFEMNWSLRELLPPCQHDGLAIGVYGHGSAGHLGQRMRTANRDEARVLMGTPNMHRDGMSQAIPPAYTEWIGRQLLAILERTSEARA